MATNVTRALLQEHFRKHDSITLYKPDGTPVTFRKQYKLKMVGGHSEIRFKDYDAFAEFYRKHHLSFNPVITV